MERQYEKLIVWKEAHKLCLKIYEETKNFPDSERFGLISQMRRASYSIPMNLAEGNSRRSYKEKNHFVTIASGSLEELHYQCLLSKDLGYLSEGIFLSLNDSIQRTGFLLQKLYSSLVSS